MIAFGKEWAAEKICLLGAPICQMLFGIVESIRILKRLTLSSKFIVPYPWEYDLTINNGNKIKKPKFFKVCLLLMFFVPNGRVQTTYARSEARAEWSRMGSEAVTISLSQNRMWLSRERVHSVMRRHATNVPQIYLIMACQWPNRQRRIQILRPSHNEDKNTWFLSLSIPSLLCELSLGIRLTLSLLS